MLVAELGQYVTLQPGTQTLQRKKKGWQLWKSRACSLPRAQDARVLWVQLFICNYFFFFCKVGKKSSPTFLYSSTWSKNYMRKIKKRKSNKCSVTCTCGRDPGKLSYLPRKAKFSPWTQAKDNRGCWPRVVWDFRGKEGNLHRDGKTNVW